jgi:flagellar basal body-associated protein FliL
MDRKNVILLTVLGIATFLTAMIGTTFAFFTATVTGNDTAKVTTITAATIGATYSDGDEIKATNIVPGWSASKTITMSIVFENVSKINKH